MTCGFNFETQQAPSPWSPVASASASPRGRGPDADAAGRKGPPGSLGAEAEALKRHKPSFRLLRFKVESATEMPEMAERASIFRPVC